MNTKALITISLCLAITGSTYAQNKKESMSSDTLKHSSTDTLKHLTTQPTVKIFKGLNQYRSWTIGVNTGILTASVVTGGDNDYHKVTPKFGFGVSVRKQFGYLFGVQFDGLTGHIAGSVARDKTQSIQSFNTELGYSSSVSGIVNLGGLSYMKRAHKINFFFLGGMGLIGFAPAVTYKDGTIFDTKGVNGVFKDKTYIHELTTFAGAGLRFKVSNRFNVTTGYTENFIDNDFLDGIHNVDANGRDYQKDKYAYGYAGLEYSIGKKAKPNVDWVNPALLIYDANTEQAIHEEFELLRIRTKNVVRNVAELKMDADTDGIPDWLDKCPNTSKGTKVDGTGCPVVAHHVADTVIEKLLVDRAMHKITKENVQFAYNSSEILPHYFHNLDAIAKVLKADVTKTITLTGYASQEGSLSRNIQLSAERAKAVKAYLVSIGIDEKRINVIISGITKPVANNVHEEGRVINRRVEINYN